MGHKRSRSRQSSRKKGKHPSLLKRINHNAAGIDCGSEAHYVAVPPERDAEPVRSFKTFTADLHRLADWLKACKVKTVAMESTGVYWIPIFEILEERGFEVVLVNSRHIKNVPGRKSDVLDCQWIQELHSVGLLRGSFRPAAEIVSLRAERGTPGYLRSDNGPEFTAGLIREWLNRVVVDTLFFLFTLLEANVLIERWRKE